MTARRRLAFWLVVGLQALGLLALIGWNELALARGAEVTLRTVPVDPVDLFRGRYVVLRYEISRLPVDPDARPGDVVYVSLTESGGVWSGSYASRVQPREGTFVRGSVRHADGATAEIEYGIEAYFAPEEEARRLERAGPLLVTVAVGDGGRARISRLEPVR